MKAVVFAFVVSFLPLGFARAQAAAAVKQQARAEIFSSGFIDVVNNGQVNASSRFIRLNIGEQGRFVLPLSIYGGVSNNQFQNPQLGGQLLRSNDHLINQYINPSSGLVNICVEGIAFPKRADSQTTRFGFPYAIGERLLNGTRIGPVSNPATGRPVNFLNAYVTSGVYFQTGAWERTNSNNVGIFWASLRYHLTRSNPRQIREFLPDIQTNGFYHGYSIGFGIEINNLLNVKCIYYKYAKQPEIDYGLPIYQFSINYSTSKN
ncbi:hypothetical protein [Flaviaesturariibacter amylovorans]|uniref:Transporter n=1 Tax=Flaviaesturariibacter amylovorans TaxID=1084520 RepID=A0ABP8G5S6_9BACT